MLFHVMNSRSISQGSRADIGEGAGIGAVDGSFLFSWI